MVRFGFPAFLINVSKRMNSQGAILAGGKLVAIIGADGQPRDVLVKLLKIVELAAFFAAVENEAAIVKVTTDLTTEEIESLPATALLDLVDAANELNFRNALRWGSRRADLGEALVPMLQKVNVLIPSSTPGPKLKRPAPAPESP